MGSVANVTVHASQFPENVRRDLLESLRTGEVNHKFHYDSVKQTQKWLALHQEYSPSRADADCAAVYERGFEGAAERIEAQRVHLVGIGCGGGQKDTRLLRLLKCRVNEIFYTPSDVSTAMVLVAREAALEVVPEENCHPLVCDLATAKDLPQVLEQMVAPDAARIITFFGMIPNFEPDVSLPRLSELLRVEDWLLFSANLSPGADYDAGVRKILPLYDNARTRDWLMTFLTDLGVELDDGEIQFGIEDAPMIGGNSLAARGAVGTTSGKVADAPRAGKGEVGHGVSTALQPVLKRVAAYFRFNREREICVDNERFQFGPGKWIRLFFSYRHTPKLVRALLDNCGIKVVAEWLAKSDEEGVFLCKRK
jgi:L-histidine Nalpha-methyltransferase